MFDIARDLAPIQDARDVRDLFAGLAQSVVGVASADACFVSLLYEDRDLLRNVAVAVRPSFRLDVGPHLPLARFSEARRVLETGRAVEVAARAPETDPAERKLLRVTGFSRVLITRLAVDGRGVGLLRSYRKLDLPFGPGDPARIDLLATFAANAYSKMVLAVKLEQHYTKTIEALCSALEARDPYTQAHTGRIRNLSVALAKALGVPPEARRDIGLGAILHDVGKIGIADAILRKPGPLTDGEWEIMRRHPRIGYDMLSGIDFLDAALPVVRHHHERWDGRGYPTGAAGDTIPLAARIVSVCDAFDAMTSDRLYRRALRLEQACDEILAGAGRQFDPRVAEVLVEVVDAAASRAGRDIFAGNGISPGY